MESFKTDQGTIEGLAEISVVDAEQVQGLSQQGWRLLKIVSSQSRETLSKQFPYLPSGSYSPMTCPYSEDAVVQRSKFVMGRPGEALKAEVQAELDQTRRTLSEERAAHEKATATILDLEKECIRSREEIRSTKYALETKTKQYEDVSARYTNLKTKFDALEKATLETLVKLPGGNEVSIDDAGKMLRASEILEGKS